MEAEMKTALSTPMEDEAALAAAASWVLGDDDLLRMILVRVDFPTTLVRAALVCRRWYRIASRPDFLRLFCDLHPARLLGFYLSTRYYGWKRLLEFVPMLPQPPELATVLRRGSFSFDSSMCIEDCWNGRVLVGSYLPAVHKIQREVYTPLHPMRSPVVFPQVVNKHNNGMCHWELLSKESGDDLSYFWLIMDFYNNRGADITVYKLQGGDWRIHAFVATEITACLRRKSLLVEDKIYFIATERSIYMLDLTSSCLSTIMLPDGVFADGNILLSRANGSGVYLVEVKALQVCIWLFKGTHGNPEDWLMVDMFCLRDMCANLRDPKCMSGDGGTDHVYLNAVGDNAEFLFLNMDQSVLFLDVRSRAMRKVYEHADRELCHSQITPYIMIWPPVLPVLKE